jgi:YHS domain-containing protein
MKRIIFLAILGLFVFGVLHILAQAQETSQTAATETKAIDVGNKICPVSGEKIDEKMKATYEYNGKIYNFCCSMCIEDFKKDPQKYIKKVEEEVSAGKSQAQEEAKTDAVTGATHPGMHEGHHH